MYQKEQAGPSSGSAVNLKSGTITQLKDAPANRQVCCPCYSRVNDFDAATATQQRHRVSRVGKASQAAAISCPYATQTSERAA